MFIFKSMPIFETKEHQKQKIFHLAHIQEFFHITGDLLDLMICLIST